MSQTIASDALKTMLIGLLSCKCPVTETTEKALWARFFSEDTNEVLDLAPFMDIVHANPVLTPLHHLVEFCSYGHDSPQTMHISLSDVLRYFSSRFHYRGMSAHIDPMIVRDLPSFLVTHMMIPATLVDSSKGMMRVDLPVKKGAIQFTNVAFVPDMEQKPGSVYGVHMGAALTGLDPLQVQICWNHLAFKEFEFLVQYVNHVDFRLFQHLGNHQQRIEERIARNYT
jgi:hypothetical protein